MASENKLTAHDRIDLDMVMGLIGNSIMSEGGIKQIGGLMQQARDPAGVLAQIVYQSVSAVHDKLQERDMDISDKIWTARSGVIDQTIAEIAKLVSGTSGDKTLLNPQILEGARNDVLDMMQQQFADSDDEEGPPNPDVNGLPDKSPAEEAAESPEEAEAEGDLLGGVMPSGEAGGSHGPNRMPAPIGLLSGD